MSRGLRVLSLLALLSTGCGAPRMHQAFGGVIRDYGEREFKPTPVHTAIYHLMEQCTGIKGDVSRIHWKVALWMDSPDLPYPMRGGWHRKGGYHEIIFYQPYAFDGETISHEVLHDLYDGDVPLDVADRCILKGETLGTPLDPRWTLADSASTGPGGSTRGGSSAGLVDSTATPREHRPGQD